MNHEPRLQEALHDGEINECIVYREPIGYGVDLELDGQLIASGSARTVADALGTALDRLDAKRAA